MYIKKRQVQFNGLENVHNHAQFNCEQKMLNYFYGACNIYKKSLLVKFRI